MGILLRRLRLVLVMGGVPLLAYAAGSTSAATSSAPIDPKPEVAPVPAAPVWGKWTRWGDQGDGTYRNPVLPADYSDLDCIRVGADYYAISSTFQYSPGVVILRSRDLVNWSILGHVVTDLTQIGPELNWDRMNRYGRGVWAGAIRHHAGKFWVYFGTPDEGYFMSTATDPAGPWTPLHAVLPEAGWDDCCPFWDDDGRGWLVGTHFRDGYKTWLFQLSEDGTRVIPQSRVLLLEGERREASKLYKINGTYYHFFSEWKPGVGRYVMMQRAKAITGPYTEKRQLAGAQRDVMEPNQGGLVQAENGSWYFLTHHGTGAWEGRAASLLPVTWVDGWPLIGEVGSDGLGHFVWSGKNPVPETPAVTPQSSDDFSAPTLSPHWEWNYQPRADRWSLVERPGFLRLHAFPPLKSDDLLTAGNTLTQRAVRSRDSVVTVSLDLSGMADGQAAGLTHFSRDYSAIGVRQVAGVRSLEQRSPGKTIAGPSISSDRIWLRSTWGLDGLSRYSFSEDGITFIPFGEPYALAWANYRGDRLGLYSYNNQAEAGHVDVDWFHYTYSRSAPLSR
jgi:beta-xylosidase